MYWLTQLDIRQLENTIIRGLINNAPFYFFALHTYVIIEGGRSMKVERYIDIYKRYNNKNIFIKAFNYLRYVFGFMSNEETGNYYWYTLWKKTNKS